MPGSSQAALLVTLIEQVRMERQQEIKRAIAFRGNDPVKCAYHTGLADGRNNIIAKLRAILNGESISKGDNGSGR
jgi:hypothetical protein